VSPKISFKVQGMECASCAAKIERQLKKTGGVLNAAVNFAVEKVTVDYDPDRVGVDELLKTVVDLGYRVPTRRVDLKISGMTCAACAARVEKTLSNRAGVLRANVNFAMERATVEYDPTRVDVEELKKAVADAGYRAEEGDKRFDADEEKMERERETRRQTNLLILSAALSIPLLAMMFADLFNIHLPALVHNKVFQFALATPVQLVAGFQFYRGAYKSLRHGSANMDVLVALGTTAAYFYSVATTFFIRGHVYYETGAIIITLIILDERELLRLVASLEKGSEHPLGEAIVKGAREKDTELVDPRGFEAIPGHGVSGQVGDKQLLVGNRRLLASRNIAISAIQDTVEKLEGEGKTAMLVAVNNRAAGVVAVADTVKDTSAEAIRALKEMGIETIMITGDNRRTAEAIARQVGIASQNVLAEVLPQDKAREVNKLKEQGRVVGMVGDGINDAPALATADVGFAIGTGTDVAMEAADITLMRGDLRGVAASIKLSRATMRNIKQNLFWALIYNTLGIPLAALGFLSPVLAGAAMAFSSVSVVTNALRLKRFDPYRDFRINERTAFRLMPAPVRRPK